MGFPWEWDSRGIAVGIGMKKKNTFPWEWE